MSTTCAPDPLYKIGDLVMLSTANCRHKYKKTRWKTHCKIFPCWDGPYMITHTHPEASTLHSNWNLTTAMVTPFSLANTRTNPHSWWYGRVLGGQNYWLSALKLWLVIPHMMDWLHLPTWPVNRVFRAVQLQSSWLLVWVRWWWARCLVAFPRGFWHDFSSGFWCTLWSQCWCWNSFSSNCFIFS